MAKYKVTNSKKYDDMDGVWRTIKGRHIFIKDGQSLTDALRENNLRQERPKIGTIAGEEITSLTLEGEESGEIGDYFSLKEVYEAMQEVKKMDRREFGYTDTFTVTINTPTKAYYGYKIKKYKGKIRISK